MNVVLGVLALLLPLVLDTTASRIPIAASNVLLPSGTTSPESKLAALDKTKARLIEVVKTQSEALTKRQQAIKVAVDKLKAEEADVETRRKWIDKAQLTLQKLDQQKSSIRLQAECVSISLYPPLLVYSYSNSYPPFWYS